MPLSIRCVCGWGGGLFLKKLIFIDNDTVSYILLHFARDWNEPLHNFLKFRELQLESDLIIN